MYKELYVGNLNYDITEEEVKNAFSPFGEVANVNIICDRVTGRPRGFGFVSFTDPAHAAAAVKGMNGQELCGRPLKVNESQGKKNANHTSNS